MRGIGLAIFVIACGGGGDDATDVSTDATDTETTDTTGTCDIPQYDLTSMTCEQLGTAWVNTVEAGNSCRVKEDCIVLRAECEHWENITCWHAVNSSCLGTLDIAPFNTEAANCSGQVCDCGSPPGADCISGECQAI